MRYLPILGVASLVSLLAACGSAPSTDAIERSASPLTVVDGAAPGGTTITFSANWQQTVSGALVAGEPITIVYDSARLPECGGDIGSSGGYVTTPGWTDTAFYSLNGILMGSFAVAGAGLTNGPPVFTPSTSGQLQLWFQCTSVWGNSGWDSDYGANYTFTVGAPAAPPEWIGDASALLERATCSSDGGAGQNVP